MGENLLLMIPYFIVHCILGMVIASAVLDWRDLLPLASLLLYVGLAMDYLAGRGESWSGWLLSLDPRRHSHFRQVLIYSFLILYVAATGTVLMQLSGGIINLQGF